MSESAEPRRRGRPVTTGLTPKRSLRVPDELWNELTVRAEAESIEVAALTREFYAWWLRKPSAKLPKRPNVEVVQ